MSDLWTSDAWLDDLWTGDVRMSDVNVFIIDNVDKLYHKTWTEILLSPIQTLGFFSSIDKLSAIKLQSK